MTEWKTILGRLKRLFRKPAAAASEAHKPWRVDREGNVILPTRRVILRAKVLPPPPGDISHG